MQFCYIAQRIFDATTHGKRHSLPGNSTSDVQAAGLPLPWPRSCVGTRQAQLAVAMSSKGSCKTCSKKAQVRALHAAPGGVQDCGGTDAWVTCLRIVRYDLET